MLKTLTALSALAIVLAVPARADLQFEGNIEFTAKTTACPASIKLNTQWRSRYHPGPSVAPGNDDYSAVNRVEDFAAQGWGAGGDFSTTYVKVSNGMVTDRFSGLVSGQQNISTTSLKLLVVPAPVGAGTPTLTLRGKIKNPFGKNTQKSCVVSFVGQYQNRDYVSP